MLDDIAAPAQDVPDEIVAALCDDLNTPKAFAVLNTLAKEAAATRNPQKKGQLLAAGALLGVLEQDAGEWLGYGVAGDIDTAEIDQLLAARQAARAAKDYARADDIRDRLDSMGIVIEDTPSGPKWRKA